jgi:hypothetical protein
MSSFTKDTEHYIEHEVQLRLHEKKFDMSGKRNDEKFQSIDKRFDHLDNKLNWIIGIIIGGILLPVGLHFLKLI